MNTINSLLTIGLVLAVIFVPQALAIFFSDRRSTGRDEFVSDGR